MIIPILVFRGRAGKNASIVQLYSEKIKHFVVYVVRRLRVLDIKLDIQLEVYIRQLGQLPKLETWFDALGHSQIQSSSRRRSKSQQSNSITGTFMIILRRILRSAFQDKYGTHEHRPKTKSLPWANKRDKGGGRTIDSDDDA